MPHSEDCIHVEQLEVFTRIGVTDNERAAPQRVLLSMTVWPRKDFDSANDEIANTVDYSALCAVTRDFVESRAGRLIETLARNLAEEILVRFPVRRITIQVRKFVVPNTKYVSVTLTREAQT
jgi:7,8-dihydroneopterin aldolase/epimerase/oxygenase